MKGITAILLAVTLAGAGVSAETEPEKPYTDDELYCLAHIINAEAGDSNCTHQHRVAVGSVVLNRVASDIYPDTIQDVVFQSGQYSPTWDGRYDLEPSKDSWETAEYLLTEGSQYPENCLFQAEFVQGTGVYEIFPTIYGTTYICYR